MKRRLFEKYLWGTALTFAALAGLCACGPASGGEVEKYAEQNYGANEYNGIVELGSKNALQHYFKDKEYGFEYYVTSSVNDVVIDGSKFGETESKASNFNEAYYTYILGQVQGELDTLASQYGVTILSGLSTDAQLNYNYHLAEIYYSGDDTTTASEVSEKVNKLFSQYDTRTYWEEKEIAVYDKFNEWLGSYSYKYDKWMTPSDMDDTHFIEIIAMWNSKATYLRKEEKLLKDTGLSAEDIQTTAGSEPLTDSSPVTYYYFEADGQEYFLADVLVSSGPRIDWYTNYEK